MLPPSVVSFAVGAWNFLRTRVWVGWLAAALLCVPLSCAHQSLQRSEGALAACRELLTALPPSQVAEKVSATAAVRVRVLMPPLLGSFDTRTSTAAAASSWPCPEVLVDAVAAGGAERQETHPPTPAAAAAPQDGLTLGLGYHQQPYAVLQLQVGKLAVWGTVTNPQAPALGAGAGYRFWSW